METVKPEPEELIEAALVALLASGCTTPVHGALTPCTPGRVKELTEDTFISVEVDQTQQILDFMGARVPLAFQARVAVHYAVADDPDGALFRDECRRARAVLSSLLGDGCQGLSSSSFACDAFMIDATSTSFEGGDNPAMTKTYTATVRGRTITTTTTEAE